MRCIRFVSFVSDSPVLLCAMLRRLLNYCVQRYLAICNSNYWLLSRNGGRPQPIMIKFKVNLEYTLELCSSNHDDFFTVSGVLLNLHCNDVSGQ